MSASTHLGTVAVTGPDDDGAWLVALKGEHDISTAALREELTRHWSTLGHANLVIDLSTADFIDSSVVNWLMRVRRTTDACGTAVLRVVVGPPATAIERLVGLVGLRQMFACYPTVRDALAAARFAGHAGATADLSV